MFPHQPNQSLIDGITVLQTIIANNSPIGTNELAKTLNMDQTRVNRLAKTLAAIGFLKQNKSRKYFVGPGIHILATQSIHASGILSASMESIIKLEKTNLLVSMGVAWRGFVSYIYHKSPETSRENAIAPIDIFPVESSGLGIAILSKLSNEEMIISHHNPSEKCQSLIEEAKNNGYAFIKQNSNSSATLAVTIKNAEHIAIGLSGNITKKDINKYLPMLEEASIEIGKKLFLKNNHE